jgi:CTP synthase
VQTASLHEPAREVASFAAFWVVPGSPYENMGAVIDAIRFARETRRPLLGTCGGFQHALIEFARNVAGIATADHAETNVNGDALVVSRLTCSLVGATETLSAVPDSLLHAAYGGAPIRGEYHCNYGVNERYRAALEAAGLRFTAFDAQGTPRAAELPTTMHPFFVGTLFQPERAALRGETSPLVRAFVRAIVR